MRGRLKRLSPRPEDVEAALVLLFQDYFGGKLNPSLLESLYACTEKGLPVRHANLAICMEVASGRYAEALRWRDRCHEAALKGEEELLLRINEAEAMANLGRIDEALSRIDREPTHSLTIAGAAAHRAWCAALLGRPEQGAAELSKASAGQLGLPFRSEWHLAEAAVFVAARRWLEADHALKKAKLFAMRASTKRNVHFSRGLLLAAQERHLEALTHFEQGAKAKYVGQGGDALLAWGDCLAALSRNADARRAWALCAERDPQAPAAATARSRLALRQG